MARRKTHHKRKTTHHRRHRMSGVGRGSAGLMEAAKFIGAMVVGGIASTALDRVTSSLNTKLVNGGKVLVGIIGYAHGHSPLMKGLAAGTAVSGGIALAHNMGALQNVTHFLGGIMGDANDYDNMNGIANASLVSGIPNQGMVSGPQDDDYNPGTLGERPMGSLMGGLG